MKELIERYVGQTIGANAVRPHSVEPVTVIAAHRDYFTVQPEGSSDLYHLPYLNLIKVIENPEGITIKEFFHRAHTYLLVVKLGHMVEYVPS